MTCRTIFHLDDWLAHTPKHILAKNFDVPESFFDELPTVHPYILNGTVTEKEEITGATTPEATGDGSFVYRTLDHPPAEVGGRGGTVHIVDSTNFPISKTIAAAFVRLEPGGLRELHWHPRVRGTPLITSNISPLPHTPKTRY